MLLTALRSLSLSLLLASVLLAGWEAREYAALPETYPPGTRVAGLPVGGLERRQAQERLAAAYGAPLELLYGQTPIRLDPALAGFRPDFEAMLDRADRATKPASFWKGYWDFLWGRPAPPADIPLLAESSRETLRAYLVEEIAARYDRPASPPLPYPGTIDFLPGVPGVALEVDSALPAIEQALRSIGERTVHLPLEEIPPPPPSFRHLETLLQQSIALSGFDGLAGLYLRDLQTGQVIHFAVQQGESLPIPPDVAFSGASLIKIPVMVSVFRRLEAAPLAETDNLLRAMISESGNEAADWVMERTLDPNLAPLQVTEDMRALGLENTFLAGFFRPGAPLLTLERTPANQRTDAHIDPDLYNQTSPSEIGALLAEIEACSRSGKGRLVEVFPGEITREECQAMLDYLAGNKTPYLIEAGVPEEAQVVHKHGWVSYRGSIDTIGDAALVHSAAGNYVLVIYLYHPNQLLWEPSSQLVARLSEAVYRFFDLAAP